MFWQTWQVSFILWATVMLTNENLLVLTSGIPGNIESNISALLMSNGNFSALMTFGGLPPFLCSSFSKHGRQTANESEYLKLTQRSLFSCADFFANIFVTELGFLFPLNIAL
jgi:hypothetical protein